MIKRSYEKHGLRNTPEYNSWWGMKDRCYGKNRISYKNYGGKGITVCDRWLNSFQNFLDDMDERPSSKHSLDRIDNNKSYFPDNCRWATRSEQQANQGRRIDNKSGHRGIFYYKPYKKWMVKVGKKFIGYYATLDEAIEARSIAFKITYPNIKDYK